MDGEWWRSALIYQIVPRSFQDSDGDGVGDLGGVLARLDYVASLGVDAVWLSPFFPSPMADFGYDVSDYLGVDPLFGTMTDFDRILARAHDLGLKVLIDMVWSHTSDRHPWFVDSRARGDKADWYVWADPRPDGTPPNNWLSVFGGAAWSWEPRRRQYYLHHFLKEQPALNWHNPHVADALLEIGRFWLDKGVDGFRLDAVDFLLHDPALTDNPARPVDAVPAKVFGMQAHRHDMLYPDRLAAFARIRALLDEYPGTVAMAELSSEADPVTRVRDTTAAGHLHLAYSLGLVKRTFSRANMATLIDEVSRRIGADGRLAWAFANHDVPRATTRWGDGSAASARMILALLLSLDGAACLYQGEELGLPEAELGLDDLRDPYGIAFWPEFKGRDGCRTPMPWQADAVHAGFTTGAPWLPIPDRHRPLAVDRQRMVADSPLNTVCRLARWRREHPALTRGRCEMVDLGPNVLAFRRIAPEERMLCVFNPAPIRVEIARIGTPLEGTGYRVEADRLIFDTWGAVFLAE